MSQRCHELIAERWGKKVSGTSTAELGYWSILRIFFVDFFFRVFCQGLLITTLMCVIYVSRHRGDGGRRGESF